MFQPQIVLLPFVEVKNYLKCFSYSGCSFIIYSTDCFDSQRYVCINFSLLNAKYFELQWIFQVQIIERIMILHLYILHLFRKLMNFLFFGVKF